MNRVRTVKSKDFSVIDNKIFRNTALSLKAKGLLCTMLSFAESWDLSISGLSRFCKCGKTQIKTALDEIVNEGYLVKDKQIRDENGKFAGYEWILVDEPFSFDSSKSNEKGQKIDDLPLRKNRCGKTVAENRTQININKQVSSNKYQSVFNQDDVEDFIQKVNERFNIQLNKALVTKFLETANNDLSIVYKAIEKTVAAARSQCIPIRSVRAYVITTIKNIMSESDDIEYDAVKVNEEKSAAIKEQANAAKEKRMKSQHERLMNESVNEKKCDTIHEIHEKAEKARQRNSMNAL